MNRANWICETQKGIRSKGIFLGDNPLKYPSPILLLQLTIAALVTTLFQFILNPLGESAYISQMLAGILLGPSFLGGENDFAQIVYPVKSFYISQTFAFFGCMLFLFLVGVKMDLSIVRRSGKKAVVIGLSAFFVPLVLNVGFAFVLQRTVTMEPQLHKSLVAIAVFQCLSSFHVIGCLLGDLKLLNSELGRLAVSSSMISGVISWIWVILAFTVRLSTMKKTGNLPFMGLSLAALFVLIIFIMRPIMLWMVAQTAKGQPIKESYIVSIFIMVMICSLLGEIVGQHFLLGPMVLGLAVPDGPPLGSALVEKLDSYVSNILLPSYFLFSGARINLSEIRMKTVGIVELLALSSFCGKVLGTMVPSLYCKMPAIDALSLGLIMSAQGITDLLVLQHGMLLLLIDGECYSIMIMSSVLFTGIITPIVKFLYNPSKRYKSTKRRRTIEHSLPNMEFGLLVCMFHQDSTPSIINLIEVFNPTPKSPICFCLVHLIRLSGRTAPVLITHRPGKSTSLHSNNYSDHIINAFRLYQEHNASSVIMNAFTAIAPYATMHDEVCTLAFEKRTSMIIIPFHKFFSAIQCTEELAHPIRSVNRNILQNAPCSVGILVDRGTLNKKPSALHTSISGRSLYSVGTIFVEGPDDREALALATRMAGNPNVSLTVTKFTDPKQNRTQKEIDSEVIMKYKTAIDGKKQHVYKEVHVKDSVDMINEIRSMEDFFDLILVGRRHDSDSPLFMGLTEWNEFPELGFLGDMLASFDANCEVSVLVVQQQSFGCAQKEKTDIFKCHVKDSFSVVDIPHNRH
ncbi:cation/H(+) antiporter 15-like [Rosa sericea]